MQFKMGSYPFPRHFLFYIGEVLGVKRVHFTSQVDWLCFARLKSVLQHYYDKPKETWARHIPDKMGLRVKTVRRRSKNGCWKSHFQRLCCTPNFASITLMCGFCMSKSLLNVLRCTRRREGAFSSCSIHKWREMSIFGIVVAGVYT